MATRKARRNRGWTVERCVAVECPEEAQRTVAIDGTTYRLCVQHALAIEMQKARNRAHKKVTDPEPDRRRETEERLGIR